MNRKAYTLIEVLIATTILALGLAAVFGLTRSALRKSADAADLADAQLACQTTLNELLAKQDRIRSFGPKEIEGLIDWKMTLSVHPSTKQGLYTVHFTAQKYQDGIPYGVLFQLLRWVPEHRVELAEQSDVIDEMDEFADPLW